MKQYLGIFYKASLLKEDIAYFDSIFEGFSTYIVYGRKSELLKVGKYFLLNWGRKVHDTFDAYEFLCQFFSKDDSGSQAKIVDTNFLIFYKFMGEIQTKYNQSVCAHTITQRLWEDKVTLFLSEDTNLLELERIEGVKVVNISSGIIFNSKKPVKGSITGTNIPSAE